MKSTDVKVKVKLGKPVTAHCRKNVGGIRHCADFCVAWPRYALYRQLLLFVIK